MDKPPFDPDKKPKKIAVAGKNGYGRSAAAHLAKTAMKKAAEKKMANEATNYVDEVRDPSMAGVKVGEKVRLTNPKASPRHTLDKIKGNTAYIIKGDGSKMTLPLDRIKRVKAQSMKEEVEHLDESVKAAKAAAVEAHKKGMSSTAAENHILDAVISAHRGKSEGAGGGVTRAKINNATIVGVAHFNKLRGMNEEKEMLTLRDILEVRGRKPTPGSKADLRRKAAAAAQSGNSTPSKPEVNDFGEPTGPDRPASPHLTTEPDKHISVQLKVAQDMKDEKGGADVKFANGKTHFVTHDVAGKVLNALDKVKPAQRADLHDHIAQSHDNLMAVHKLVS